MMEFNEFTKILKWFSKNYLKLILFIFFMFFLYFLIILLTPIFEFFGLIHQVIMEIQNFLSDFEKRIEKFNLDEIRPRRNDDEA